MGPTNGPYIWGFKCEALSTFWDRRWLMIRWCYESRSTRKWCLEGGANKLTSELKGGYLTHYTGPCCCRCLFQTHCKFYEKSRYSLTLWKTWYWRFAKMKIAAAVQPTGSNKHKHSLKKASSLLVLWWNNAMSLFIRCSPRFFLLVSDPYLSSACSFFLRWPKMPMLMFDKLSEVKHHGSLVDRLTAAILSKEAKSCELYSSRRKGRIMWAISNCPFAAVLYNFL